MIDTTIYIDNEKKDRLEKASSITGYNVKELIIALLKLEIKSQKKNLFAFKRINYQKIRCLEQCRRIHLYLSEDEYEFLLDIRKFFKISVSHLLGISIRKNLLKIINQFLNNESEKIKDFFDNYPRNYLICQRNDDNIKGWWVYWGFPVQFYEKMIT